MTDQTPEQQLDAAYRERAQLLAWLAALVPSAITLAPDVDEPGWKLLFLHPSGGQLSWHISPRDDDLFDHVERAVCDDPRVQWDGHTTAEKYDRIRSIAAAGTTPDNPEPRCSPACSEGHTYAASCALCCAPIDGGTADQSWSVRCPQCAAQPGQPCRRPDGTARAVSDGRRWNLWEHVQAAKEDAARTTPDNPPASGDAADNPAVAEPDNPTAYALARHIADHPMSTVQAAFRYLNTPLSFELHDDGLPDAVAAPATADDGLRAELVAALVKVRWDGMGGYTEAEACQRYAAAVLAVRDDELARLRAEVEQMRRGRDEWMDLGKNADRLLLRAMARRDRYRDAWKSARIRAARNGQSADRLLDAANAAIVESGRADATLAEVRRWAQAFGPTGVLDILDGKAAGRG